MAINRLIILLAAIASFGLAPDLSLANSASTQVSQQVNGGAPVVPPPSPTPVPQLGNGPIVDTSPASTVNVIANVRISSFNDGALISWMTTAPSLTSLSWGSASGIDAGTLQETLPRTDHVAYLAHLSPATRYALDLNAASDRGVATYRGIVFTTLPQPTIIPSVPPPPPQSVVGPPVSSPPPAPAILFAPVDTRLSGTFDDFCPNLSGTQNYVPLGIYRAPNGDCVPLTSVDRIVDHAPPIATEPDTSRLITFAFVPSFLRIPVSLSAVTGAIRILTGGNADTLLTHDPSPQDPATPIDATGAVSLAVLCTLIIVVTIRGLVILLL